MCLTPVTIKRDYNTIDGQTTAVVPCGKCPKCLRRRQNAWSFRLYEEGKRSNTRAFLTLTYKDTPLSGNGLMTLKKRDLQLFLKKLRKKSNRKIKYYAVGEYGGKYNRPHYHLIIFNLPPLYLEHRPILTGIWNHGIVDIGTVTMASVRYVCGYVMQGTFQPEHENDDRAPHFSTMSKGLGKSFLTPQQIKYQRERVEGFVRMPEGWVLPLPRFYKETRLNTLEEVRSGEMPESLYTLEQRKLLAEASQEVREADFEKLFNDDYHNYITWLKDQFRKEERRKRLQNHSF